MAVTWCQVGGFRCVSYLRKMRVMRLPDRLSIFVAEAFLPNEHLVSLSVGKSGSKRCCGQLVRYA